MWPNFQHWLQIYVRMTCVMCVFIFEVDQKKKLGVLEREKSMVHPLKKGVRYTLFTFDFGFVTFDYGLIVRRLLIICICRCVMCLMCPQLIKSFH